MINRLRDNAPLVAAAVLTVVLFTVVQLPSVTTRLSQNLDTGIQFVQLFAVVVYLLLFGRFVQHRGLISEYDPQQRLAEVIGDYLGPAVGLAVELTQILAYAQVSKLLFAGITFNDWNHDLSQIDAWLLTFVAIVVLTVALINVLSRAQDLRNSWDNIAEVIETNTD